MAWIHVSERLGSSPICEGTDFERLPGRDGWYVEIPEGELSIGRMRPASPGRSAWLVLELGSISRRHCRFLRQGSTVLIEDTGSACGTPVNGCRTAAPTRLRHGDEIGVGGLELTFLERLPREEVPDDHFTRIYRRRARAYERLVEAEDFEGNLPAALSPLLPRPGARVLDLGTGTGRLPRLLAPLEAKVVGLDLHLAMLREARGGMRPAAAWDLAGADMRELPVRSGCADLVTAGWSIGHFTGWFGEGWPRNVAAVLAEMKRAARPGGHLVILETLGTGREEPAAPTRALADYYNWLEEEHGFSRQTLRTDYRFESPEAAVEGLEFFFGPELSGRILERGWARVPEWTGLWTASR